MIVIKKKTLGFFCLALAVILTFLLCFSSLSKSASGNGSSGITIVIDAGHGGIDNGVSGVNTGVKESELNLIVSKKLEKCFFEAGMNVVLTRKTEGGLYGVAVGTFKKRDMKKRKEIIEKAKPNVVISIHMNKFPVSSRRGGQVFYKSGDEKGQALAGCIQNCLNKLPESVRNFNPLRGDYFILNCTSYPSVIIECGFLSNPEDEALLITDAYQDKLAYSIFKGVIEYLSVTTNGFCNY